jgi:hypothetical protein
MAETTYSYDIAAAFPSGKVHPGNLKNEILASPISVALSRVDASGIMDNSGVYSSGIVAIVFKEALSNVDRLVLDNLEVSPAGGLLLAHDHIPNEDPISVAFTMPPVFNVRKPIGPTRFYYFSPDFCDKTTWYHEAVKVTSLLLSGDNATITFSLQHGEAQVTGTRIVDLSHGKITEEDEVAPEGGNPGDYVPVVRVDGVTLSEHEYPATSGGDYSIDHVNGTITFATAPSTNIGNIDITYWYVPADAKVLMRLIPPPGKKITIDEFETQFSLDMEMNDSVIQGAYLIANDYPVQPEVKYKNMNNFDDFSKGSLPKIPAMAGTRGYSQERIVKSWIFLSELGLSASNGIYMGLKLKNGIEFGGERATFTLYGLIEDE